MGFDGREISKEACYVKRRYLSKGGRFTLTKSTLLGLQMYFLSLFTILRRVNLRLENIYRGFLCGGGGLEKRPHLANWSIACLDKKYEY